MKVSFYNVNDYDVELIKEKLIQAVENLGGFKNFFSNNDKILLKPNLLASDNPDTGVVTHPLFFEAVIKFFKEEAKLNSFQLEIACGDSPAVSPSIKVAKDVGIFQVCQKYNIPFIEFKEKVQINGDKKNIIKNFEIASEVLTFDKIICLPKLKNHSLTIFTGGMKNLFGVIPGKTKAYLHTRFPDSVLFSKMIVDLADSLKTGLCFMDGIIAHEGEGPRGGNPIKLGYVIVGENPFIVDLLASTLVGYNPENIPFLKYYSEKHQVSLDIDSHQLSGDQLIFRKDFKRISFYKKTTIPKRFRKGFFYNYLISSRPFIDTKKCVLCLQCYNICPTNPKSIQIIGDKFHLEKNEFNKSENTSIKEIGKKDFNNIENINLKEIKDYRLRETEGYRPKETEETDNKLKKIKKLKYNYNTCIRCFCCQEICPHKAIEIKTSIVGKLLKSLK